MPETSLAVCDEPLDLYGFFPCCRNIVVNDIEYVLRVDLIADAWFKGVRVSITKAGQLWPQPQEIYWVGVDDSVRVCQGADHLIKLTPLPVPFPWHMTSNQKKKLYQIRVQEILAFLKPFMVS